MLLDILSLVLCIVATPVDTVALENDDGSHKRFIIVFKENLTPEDEESHRNKLAEKLSKFSEGDAVKRFLPFDIPGLKGFVASIPNFMMKLIIVIIFKTNIRMMLMLISSKRTLPCPLTDGREIVLLGVLNEFPSAKS
jgi:hypothetical protein